MSLDSTDPDPRYVTRLLEVGGVFHLVGAREPWDLAVRRVIDAEACAVRQLEYPTR